MASTPGPTIGRRAEDPSEMLRWLVLATVVFSLVSPGCGGGEEPSEIPKAPPKGKSLPR